MTLLFSCCDLNWTGIELITSIESIIIDGLLRLLVYYDIYIESIWIAYIWVLHEMGQKKMDTIYYVLYSV